MRSNSTLTLKTIALIFLALGAANFSSAQNTDTVTTIFYNNNPQARIPKLSYMSIAASAVNDVVIISWTTINEQNNDHFEIERSFDGKKYKTIGIALDGFEAGNGKAYKYKDNSIELKGKTDVFYRLKQFNLDGKASYSKIIVAKIEHSVSGNVQASPNPFSASLNIFLVSDKETAVTIQLISTSGQIVLAKQSKAVKGNNNIIIDNLENLAKGIYVARVLVGDKELKQQKVVKD